LSDEIIVPVEETVEIVPTEIVPSDKFNLQSPGRWESRSSSRIIWIGGINTFMKIFTDKGFYVSS
jgi:hypothetical protein